MSNPILRHFNYEHLPAGYLQTVARRFSQTAHYMEDLLPDGPEKSTALRKLLEAKDAAVRAALDEVRGEEPGPPTAANPSEWSAEGVREARANES